MVGSLGNDSRIIKNKMENGLTYYLIKNSAIKGCADFALIQKMGMALQDSTDSPMVYLMNTMSLTDTRNFPDGEIFTFIDNMGLDIREDLSVEMNDKSMSFVCRNVPLNKNPMIVDSMLLALCNIASCVSIDDNSVYRGKEFLKNIFSSAQNTHRRVEDSLRRVLYAGTEYAYMPVERLFEMVDDYSAADIEEFYLKYSRPELQAIVISGDIDVATVETKLKSLFQTLPKSRVPNVVDYRPMPPLAQKRIFYFEDKEATVAEISFRSFTTEHNKSLRSTAVPYVYDYMSAVVGDIISQRLSREIANASFHPFSLDVERESYLGLNSLTVNIACAPNDYPEAYAFVASQLSRLVRDGAYIQEYQRAHQRYIRHLEYLYNKRNMMDNSYYMSLCLNNFVSGYNMNSIELYKSYIDVVKDRVSKEDIDRFMKLLLKDERNSLLTCISPVITDSLEEVQVPELPPFEVDSLSGFYHPPVKKTPRWKEELKEMLSIENPKEVFSRRLGNGILLASKYMSQKPGWVEFEAVSRGGISLSEDNHEVLGKYLNDVARLTVTGGYDAYEMDEIQRGSFLTLRREISLGETKLVGRFHKDYLDDFMKLLSLYFEQVTPDADAFEKYLQAQCAVAEYANNSPMERFNRAISSNIITGNGTSRSDSAFSVADLDYYSLLNFINDLYSNPADFSFIFVGDISQSDLLKSAREYLGTLPTEKIIRRRNESYNISVASYNMVEEEVMEMEFPRTMYSCKLTFPYAMKVEDRALAEVVSKIIQRRVTREFSMDGIIVNSNSKFYRYPKEVVMLDFTFSTYQYLDSKTVEDRFANIIISLAQTGVSANEIESVKKLLLLRTTYEQQNSFEYWKTMLRYRFVTQRDFYSRMEDAIKQVDGQRVEQLLQEITGTGNITLHSVFAEEYGTNDNN